MSQLLISLLSIGLIGLSAAYPADDPKTPVDRASNVKKCTIFDPPDHDLSVRQCNEVRGKAVDDAMARDETTSIICSAQNAM